MNDQILEVEVQQKEIKKLTEGNWYVAQAPFMTPAIRELVTQLPYEAFVPMLTTTYEGKCNGKTIKRTAEKLLTFNYVFIRGEQAEIEENLKSIQRIHLLYHRPGVAPGKSYGSYQRKPMIVTDKEMQMFIKTVSLYRNGAPIANVSPDILQKGDTVRITGGAFEGVEGILVTQKGKSGGKVVVSISNLVSVTTLDIEPQYIQIIKFAHDNKHIYRKLDQYMQFVQVMAEKRLHGETVTEEKCQQIRTFVNNFSLLETETKNTLAKLRVLIFLSYIALGIDDHAVSLYHDLRNNILPSTNSERSKTLINSSIELYRQICKKDSV